MRQAPKDPARHEAGAEFRATTRTPNDLGDRARSDGLRAIERHADVLTAQAADRLDRHVGSGDPSGLDARYLVAVGDSHYNSAFGKLISDPQHGHLRFTPDEVTAVQRVTAAEAQRGLVEGTPSAGGFALPFLDASIMLTSDGALDQRTPVTASGMTSCCRWPATPRTASSSSGRGTVTPAGTTATTRAQTSRSVDAWRSGSAPIPATSTACSAGPA